MEKRVYMFEAESNDCRYLSFKGSLGASVSLL